MNNTNHDHILTMQHIFQVNCFDSFLTYYMQQASKENEQKDRILLDTYVFIHHNFNLQYEAKGQLIITFR